VGRPGLEPGDTGAARGADRRIEDAEKATQGDSKRRGVSASTALNVDDAIRTAAKLAIDAGDLDRARALLDLLEASRTNPRESIVSQTGKTTSSRNQDCGSTRPPTREQTHPPNKIASGG
jgi:hypothetical protein